VFTAHGLLEGFLQKWVVIVGHSELLLRKGALGSKDRERAETILRAATKARTVMRQAMRRHREQVEDKPLVSLNRWVERIATSARPYLDPNIGWVNDLDPEVGMVRIREGQLFQMARILVPRSLEAMPRGGTLTVRTRRTEGRANWQPGSYGSFAVVDTGESGSDVERKSRRRRRRATRQLEEKRNSGLLAEVEELVRSNNGYVECGVVPGVGRAYEVFLPTARPEPEETSPELSAESLPAGCETILVIEPDELSLRLVPETLRSKGYEVLHAHSSADVREVVDQHRGYIHLIVFNPLAGDAVSETLGRLDGRQPRPRSGKIL
jgi:two-component system cell cycle sensor histidine kinase/response regulator CckA